MIEKKVSVKVDEGIRKGQSCIQVTVTDEERVRAQLLLARGTGPKGISKALINIAVALIRGRNEAVNGRVRERTADMYLEASDNVPDLKK
jgi:hypothetical protein